MRIRSKFAVYCTLVFSWLAFCAGSCDPEWDPPIYWTYVCAHKPAKVDSMELRITYKAGDSVWTDSESWPDTSFLQKDRNDVCIECFDKCDSLFSLGKKNKISIDLSFNCDGKTISFPTYVVDKSSIHWGKDRIDYHIVELDERKIHGKYIVETFLPPNDSSCGKFVNFAVLRLP